MSLLIASWGAGVDSTAMLVGLHERGIRPDAVLFADTGGEKPATYQYIEIFQQWLSQVGFPELQIVLYGGKDATLEDECLRLKVLPSIAYGFKKCSQKWKRDPQDRFCNNWQPAKNAWTLGEKVTKVIGFDAGETRRATFTEDKKYRYWFPLIEWLWARRQCKEAILRAGLPLPPKSACFFCPSSKKEEVLSLKDESPDLYGRAVEMERNAAETNRTVKGLGRHWSWEALGNTDDKQRRLFPEVIDIPCECFDGNDEDDEEAA